MFEESAELAREAIKLDPYLPELHNNLGGALAELGRMDEAESAIRNAIRLQPDLAEARFNLGVILASRGDTDAAMSQWRDAIRSKNGTHAGARYNLAVVLASRGDPDAAAEHLDIALLAEPLFERARILRGSSCVSLGSPHVRSRVPVLPDISLFLPYCAAGQERRPAVRKNGYSWIVFTRSRLNWLSDGKDRVETQA